MIRAFNVIDKTFNNNGDAVIAATKARVKNEDNGDFTLNLICGSEYNDFIQPNNIIVAPTPSGAQAFRIRQVEKKTNRIEAKCYHVFYDADNLLIADSYAFNMNVKQALEHFNAATDTQSPFTMDSNITALNNLRIVRGSLVEAITQIIERWGGHLVRDNYNISILGNIGRDNGITIEYKKNLKELTASYDWSNVVTKLLPVGKDGILLDDLYVYSTTQYDIPFTKTLSFEQEIEREEYQTDEEYIAALKADLREQAQNYVNVACVPTINYTLKGNPEKVTDIGDVIEVKDSRIGVNILTKVIAYEYDAIANRYVNLEFGNFTPKLSSLMSDIKSETATQIASATNNINIEVNAIENAVTILNSSINQLENGKQNKLTAGENIVINNDIISAKSINVLYGADAPEDSSGNNKDFYLKLVNTGDVLSLDKFHNENSTEQNPIYLTDFTATSRNEYSFIIHGCPDAHGHGEWCYFELDGLIEGNTYGLTFKMQFNSGATFPWPYNDYIETCGEKINFQKNSALNTYSCTFTYEAGGQMLFSFPAINDNVNFTATITDMVITGDFVPKDIEEIYNKHEDTWRKYTPPASASALSELTDVELTNLTDKDIIEWDEIAEKWKNKPNSGGGGNAIIVDGHVYSATEKQVGVWLNGKPIYEKTYELQTAITVSYNSWSSSGISTSGIEQLINVITYYNATCWGGSILTTIDQGDFRFQTARNGASCSLNKFVVQYTKSADRAGSGGYQAYGFSPIIYSEEEREVGVWIDNKPLYQITYDAGSNIDVKYNSWTNITINELMGSENIVMGYGTNSGGTYTPLQVSWTGSVGSKIIQVQTPRNSNNQGVRYFTILYTKSADIAGSEKYNTLGVPTVHYDTTEQVIGTFLGKTLYQKIFDWSSSPVNIPSTWSVTTIDSSNIERVIECKGHHSDGTFYTTDADPTGNNHTKLKMRNNGGGGTYSYVTLQYTKITD